MQNLNDMIECDNSHHKHQNLVTDRILSYFLNFYNMILVSGEDTNNYETFPT